MVSLAAVHKQLTEKKREGDVPEGAGECPRVLSWQQHPQATSLLLGGGGTLLGATQQLVTASVVFFFFARSSLFEKDNRKITAACTRHYMETSKT